MTSFIDYEETFCHKESVDTMLAIPSIRRNFGDMLSS